MVLKLTIPNYLLRLKEAQPTLLKARTVHPPLNAMGAIQEVKSITIPPLNTQIQFDILPSITVQSHPGLSSIDITTIPVNFNWREDGGDKQILITTPGNQMLCGSCWAIAAAGIIADNFVVSGVVSWKPDLSTTNILSCFPQAQCKGGNPAQAFVDIAQGGIASKHCIDYSWCSTNDQCNGKATKHFDPHKLNLSFLIPKCGCYYTSPHYLYKIDGSQQLSLNESGMSSSQFFSVVKKHIQTNGSVLGGFIVFKNFMHGAFTKVNGGVYLENATYDDGPVNFNNPNIATSENFMGAHAVAVIGWGVQKDVVVDKNGTKKDVPYWYCRNSWTTNWGDGGYFKMAMYPFNKTSQFDNQVYVSDQKGGLHRAGGMVLIKATKSPEKINFPLTSNNTLKARKILITFQIPNIYL